MWSKITHVLKARQPLEPQDTDHPDVMSKVYEQHPNLSVFHSGGVTASEGSEVPFPIPSPPSSPSKHGRRGMFRRNSKVPKGDSDTDSLAPSPLSLAISLPKKVKSSLHLDGNVSQTSLTRGSMETTRPQRPSQDSARSPLASSLDMKYGSTRSILRDPNTPGTGQNVRFFSRDAYKVISPDASVASDGEPPTTSLFNRFSEAGNGSPDAVRLDKSKQPRPTAASIFSQVDDPDNPMNTSTPASSKTFNSLNIPVPPPDMSNIFDISQEHDLPTIPVGFDIPLLDSAIEIEETIDEDANQSQMQPMGVTSPSVRPSNETMFHSMAETTTEKSPGHDRSHSFSFGQTVFHSMNRSSSSTTDSELSRAKSPERHSDSPSMRLKNRSRALSDTVFQSMMRSSPAPSSSSSNKPLPEDEINDESSNSLILYSAPTNTEPPDPFRANATTYYTPQTLIPPTPPRHIPPQHARKASKEEDLIWSLRTQLAVQQELCSQYEVDLNARDELVGLLNSKLDAAERDGRERRSAVRAWKRKVTELERACRGLEEEVERSREDSIERSVMDEASGEALRQLHRQIAALEREKGDMEKRERLEREKIEGENKELSKQVEELREVVRRTDENERVLREGIEQAKQEMEQFGRMSLGVGVGEELKKLVVGQEQASEDERERHRAVEFRWDEERAELSTLVEQLQVEKEEMRSRLEEKEQELAEARDELGKKDAEYGLLKAEVEAQWKHSETASEKIQLLQLEKDASNEVKRRLEEANSNAQSLQQDVEALAKEREVLRGEVDILEAKIQEIEVDNESRKTELENELQDCWTSKEVAERERDELDEQLIQEREHAQSLTLALEEREDRVTSLEQEHRYALDTISRLEENVRQCDTEIASYSARLLALSSEAESAREEVARAKREYGHDTDERARTMQELASRESEARAQLEALVREKAEAEVRTDSLKERAAALATEVERLRRVVHELQQESADKEVRIVQLEKGRAQDKEDAQGLNMALDSKQQELELIKRKLGVRGTAGSTPSQPSKIAHHRRESSVFSTPGVPRPSSALSDIAKDRRFETPKSGVSALGKSIRVNGSGSVAPSSSLSTSTTGASSSLKPTRSIDGSMGPPPPPKARASLAGTPTPAQSRPPSSFSRPVTGTPVVHRRASSSTLDQGRMKTATASALTKPITAAKPTPVGIDEKENVTTATPTTLKAARRTSVSIPA